MKKNEVKVADQQVKTKKKRRLGLPIAIALLTVTTGGLAIAYGMSQATASTYEIQLENVYQKNLYDLVESVNNAETKLSKILVSTDSDFQNKTLVEVAHNADLAEQSLSGLPVSRNSLSESMRFINQVSGYTQTLSEKLSKGGKLTSQELQTLSDIKESITYMRDEIDKFTQDTQGGYSILQKSLDFEGEQNAFTIRISKIKNEKLDYPTMIYDGPFSDSETNVEIKGLSGNEVSKDDAYNEISKCFNNISTLTYLGEINSKFQVYNFELKTTNNQTLYPQVTKIGGNILTVSGQSNPLQISTISLDEGVNLALSFAKENGIENPECVWKEALKNEGYYNIAPKQNGVILYPDLVKVKIDLSTGTVIGYDASTYFTNHTNRLLPKAKISVFDAQKVLPLDEYIFEDGRLVLAPLDYSREVLCYEFIGQKNGSVYYFYINALNGKEENILKVIKTTDGSKLM